MRLDIKRAKLVEMTEQIKTHFEKVFELLLFNNKIIIPQKEVSECWLKILNEWVDDEQMVLFVRKGNDIRGSISEIYSGRKIMTTDNTPAHWIFRNTVFSNRSLSKQTIAELIHSNQFPVSFIKKGSEKDTLVENMLADKAIKEQITSWKLAHIDRIALKRSKNIPLEEYKNHHRKFLDLNNMYLIDKEYSGLAETPLFNTVVKNYICK